jgi:heat shock protein HslJ
MPSYAYGYGYQLLQTRPTFHILSGTNWQVTEIYGADISSIVSDAEVERAPGLFFSSESSLSGFNGCQGFGFDAEWDKLPSSSMMTIDVGAMNRIRCRTDELEEMRDDFMSVLAQEAIAYTISENEQELTLYNDDMPAMILTRIPRPVQPHERLIGTKWIATDIRGHHTRNTLRPVLEDVSMTLSFSQDEISGNAGCNQFFGDISSMTSTTFEVADYMSMTAMHCGKRIMEQERAFMRIIENSSGLEYTLSHSRVGDELEVSQPGSSVAARFVPFVAEEEIDSYDAGYEYDPSY